MKNASLLLLLSLLFSCGNYTTYKTIVPFSNSSALDAKKYAQFLANDEVEVNSWYHYVTSKNSKGEYKVRVFYPEKNQLTSLFTYKSQTEMVKNGEAKEWYDDGSKIYEGQFLNGKRTGLWKNYQHENSILSDSGKYVADLKQGVWHNYDSKGRLSSYYTFEAGQKEGAFFVFDTMGVSVNNGIYKADTLFQQTNPPPIFYFDEVNPSFIICSDSMLTIDPYCGARQLTNYITKNLEYPQQAIELQIDGTAYIEFVIDHDGSIKDVRAIRGVCQAIEAECIRIIENMPKWEQPGMQAGKPVSVKFTIPIKLRLA